MVDDSKLFDETCEHLEKDMNEVKNTADKTLSSFESALDKGVDDQSLNAKQRRIFKKNLESLKNGKYRASFYTDYDLLLQAIKSKDKDKIQQAYDTMDKTMRALDNALLAQEADLQKEGLWDTFISYFPNKR
ncbi:MAG: hypothetical protein GXP45_03710 [bacterium]|nr:hypothetical protein [bacterium]